VPPWRSCITLPENKASLTQLLSNYIETNAVMSGKLESHRRLYLAGGYADGRITKCLTTGGSEDARDLFSTQEEADTCMLLRTIKAVHGSWHSWQTGHENTRH